MPTKYVRWEYGDGIRIVKYDDGSEDHIVEMIVGGKDKDGNEYSLVIEGPAQGERVYE